MTNLKQTILCAITAARLRRTYPSFVIFFRRRQRRTRRYFFLLHVQTIHACLPPWGQRFFFYRLLPFRFYYYYSPSFYSPGTVSLLLFFFSFLAPGSLSKNAVNIDWVHGVFPDSDVTWTEKLWHRCPVERECARRAASAFTASLGGRRDRPLMERFPLPTPRSHVWRGAKKGIPHLLWGGKIRNDDEKAKNSN